MVSAIITKMRSLDFVFENLPVRVIANRNCPEIKLAGLNVGPFEEGNEYEIRYWIASELQKFGVVRFRGEETLDASTLYRIHWKERAQSSGQLSSLPEDFYPKVRRVLAELKAEIARQPEKVREYEKIKHLSLDIVNLRLKKIVSLATTPVQTEQFLKSLTQEERLLYEELYRNINLWRTKILEFKGEKE
ncbi:MAG: hypothetical protein ACPLZC_02420 [Candidatus Bathyarchaeales archaeon]